MRPWDFRCWTGTLKAYWGVRKSIVKRGRMVSKHAVLLKNGNDLEGSGRPLRHEGKTSISRFFG